jgi:hypothetical protein
MDGEIEDPWGKMYLKSVMGDLLCTKLTVLMFGYAMKLYGIAPSRFLLAITIRANNLVRTTNGVLHTKRLIRTPRTKDFIRTADITAVYCSYICSMATIYRNSFLLLHYELSLDATST